MDELTYDVAVLGGGISGLYAAWRLVTSGRPGDRRVCVVEAAPRLGGRVETIDPPTPGARLELGAMRFMADHDLVRRLSAELGVRTRRIESDDGGRGFYHLRGARFRAGDLSSRATRLPYQLRDTEQAMHPDDLFSDVIGRALAETGRQIPRDRAGWNELKMQGTFRGIALDDLGFWNVAGELLSSEAYAYLRDANGYDCNNWAAGEVMQTQLASFGKDASYSRFADGTASLTTALANGIEAAGGNLLAGHRVLAVSAGDSGPASVAASIAAPGTGADGDRVRSISARHAIIAMPPRAIALIDAPCLTACRADLEAVVSQPALKVLLGFESPWWEDEPLRIGGGRSNTDLPIRQVYYLDDHKAGHETATLMIVCNDDRSYDYFQPLAATSLARLCDGTVRDPAVGRILGHVLSQLETLHGVRLPTPVWIAVRDWVHDPFGGAYHGWRPGRRGWEVARRLRRPVADLNLHICGSAFSDLPTWMEGALGNTEKLLREVFELPVPQWLAPVSYLGW
jgi:lysine 2-monooxygenase